MSRNSYLWEGIVIYEGQLYMKGQLFMEVIYGEEQLFMGRYSYLWGGVVIYGQGQLFMGKDNDFWESFMGRDSYL